MIRSSSEQFLTVEPCCLVSHELFNISCPELISHPTRRQDIDVSQLKTKVQEMKKQIKILELQAELETKTKILELKAELVSKHVKLEAQIRKTEKFTHQRRGQSQSFSTSHHSASPKSVTSTGRPESPGAKAVKDDKDHVFGKLRAKLSRSAPHARLSNSTSNSPGLLDWLTGNILKAHGKNRSI